MLSENSKKEYSMFYPKTKSGLLIDYPKLKDNEALRKLGRFDLLFVWYYACKASPFQYEEDKKEKTELSLVQAFGEKKAETMRYAYIPGNFPEKIRLAITEMSKFEIGPRIRAKLMIENIMTNYEILVDVDPKTEFTNKDGDVDWTKKKAYIDACSTISKSMSTLISQAEGSFGVSETEEGDIGEIDSEDLIDTFHESQ